MEQQDHQQAQDCAAKSDDSSQDAPVAKQPSSAFAPKESPSSLVKQDSHSSTTVDSSLQINKTTIDQAVSKQMIASDSKATVGPATQGSASSSTLVVPPKEVEPSSQIATYPTLRMRQPFEILTDIWGVLTSYTFRQELFTYCMSNNCPALRPLLHFESGFEDGHKFYIFSGMEAHIFDRSLYQNMSNITVTLEKVPLKNFFICGQRTTSTLGNFNEFSGSPTVLILCFVVALLLMAGLAIWFYLRRRHKGDNLAKQPNKMTSALKSTKSSRQQKSNNSIRSLRSHKSSSKRKSCKSLKSRKLFSKKSKSIKTRKSSKRSLKGKSKSRSLKRKSSSKLKRKSTSRLKRKSTSKRKSHKNTLKHNSSKQLQHLSKRNSLRKHSKRGSLGSLKKITR